MKKNLKVSISLLLVVILMVSTMVIAASPASSLDYLRVYTSYSSTDYTNGVYYKRLRNVTLTGNQRNDIMNVAASQIGYHEGNSKYDFDGNNTTGNKNYTEYTNWYGGGDNGNFAWCAAFVSWCSNIAGSKSVVPKKSFVSHYYTFYKNKKTTAVNAEGVINTNASVLYEPQHVLNGSRVLQRGDIVLFSRPLHKKVVGHIGFVEYGEPKYDANGKLTAYYVHVLEGNAENKVKRTAYNLLAKTPTDWTAGGTLDGYEYTPYVSKYEKNNDGVNDDPSSRYYHDYIGYFASPNYAGQPTPTAPAATTATTKATTATTATTKATTVTEATEGSVSTLPAGKKASNVVVKVTASSVNIRKSHTTSSTIVGRLYKGAMREYVATKVISGVTWFQLANSEGWISSNHAAKQPNGTLIDNYDKTIVVKSSSLNIRLYADTSSKKTGTVYKNNVLKYNDTVTFSGKKWYKLVDNRGWVLGTYVTDTTVVPTTPTPAPTTAATTKATTAATTKATTATTKATTAPTTKPTTAPTTSNPYIKVIAKAIKVSVSSVNLRSSSSTSSSIVGRLYSGALREYVSSKVISGVTWYKLANNEGWLSSKHVTALTNVTVDTTPKYFKTTASVNIRRYADTGSTKVGSLSKGVKCQYTDTVVFEGVKWYRLADNRGWVHGNYVKVV